MVYTDPHIGLYCTACPGNYPVPTREAVLQSAVEFSDPKIGFLAGFAIPPAGRQELSKEELLRAGVAWQNLERLAVGSGMCPRCSSRIDISVEVCDRHEPGEGVCPTCESRHALRHYRTCRHCNYARWTQVGRLLLANTALIRFLSSHGINPIAPESPMEFLAVLDTCDEEVVSTDPLEARLTFSIEDERLSFTLDGDLTVTEVTAT
jgi:hypothetical protein